MDWNAIALVLVGAVAGIGGTAIHEWLRHRREQELRAADMRRDVVVAFAAAATRAKVAMGARTLTAPEIREIVNEAGHKRSVVRLVCPELRDVTTALYDALVRGDDYRGALETYEDAARDALGIK
jgi:hypothetical protein